MWYFALKVGISALLIAAISEIAKRSTGLAALLASLPLTSLLAFIWLHIEAAPPEQIAALSEHIFWLVLPSLALFITLPLFLRHGLGFWLSLSLAIAITSSGYMLTYLLLRRFGLQS